MNGLLDLHGLVWWSRAIAGSRLGSVCSSVTLSSRILVSAVSGWELGIKAALGRLKLPFEPRRMPRRAPSWPNGWNRSRSPSSTASRRPSPPRSRRPFDRLLIAQARALRVPILTGGPTDRPVRRRDDLVMGGRWLGLVLMAGTERFEGGRPGDRLTLTGPAGSVVLAQPAANPTF